MSRYILTGGIACGKSTVVETLIKYGIKIIDADIISKAIFNENTKKIKKLFNTTLDGNDLRKFIATEIFTDTKQRIKLEMFMHPLIREEIKRLEKKMKKTDIYILDIPLYYEKSQKLSDDIVLLVTTTYDTQLDRLINRDKLTLEEANKRILSQIPNGIKEKKANYIIRNDGSLEELVDSVKVMINFYFGKKGYK